VKECYPLDAQLAGLVPQGHLAAAPVAPRPAAFLRLLRETLNRQTGDTRVEFGFVFNDRVAPVAEASHALSWKLNARRSRNCAPTLPSPASSSRRAGSN